MTTKRIFITVTVAALTGMVLGGLFGLAAGKMTPDFFRHLMIWQDVEPVGFAVFCGATTGVVLGGGLGCFGVLAQAISQRSKNAPDEMGLK
jgi:NhaP-type Na+/H+ or K+/H+ antiporter